MIQMQSCMTVADNSGAKISVLKLSAVHIADMLVLATL